jgi:hypothetical protein
VWGSAAALALLAGIGATLIWLRTLRPYGFLLCFGAVAGSLPWLVLIVVLKEMSIHASNISARTITLEGVSQEFIDALNSGDEDRASKQMVEADHSSAIRKGD